MKKYVVVAAIAALVVASAVPSQAAVNTVLAVPGSLVAGYATPVVVINRAAPATFVNLDYLGAHDVTSVVEDSQSRPKIYTAVIDAGETAEVQFRGTLAAGDYDFYCSIHPTMAGTITLQ